MDSGNSPVLGGKLGAIRGLQDAEAAFIECASYLCQRFEAGEDSRNCVTVDRHTMRALVGAWHELRKAERERAQYL